MESLHKVQTEENIEEIQRIPLSSPRFRRQVENFLAANGLRLEVVDDYFCVLDGEGSVVAGAGLKGDVIKCVAVDAAARSRGLVAPLVSHIISFASGKGISNLKVFTKPENEAIFTSLGFHTLAQAPLAILMENGHGLNDYLKTLSAGVSCHPERSEGSTGVIIMNANPFTLGHKYLVERALEQVERLFLIPVKEDVSMFPYEERQEMIRGGCGERAIVLEGSDYQISAATFPTYFLKDLTDASETQMRLDLDLFSRHIAPALGVTVRFVGSEPSDPLTARYNALMKEILPTHGISVVEIPRLSLSGDRGGENSSVSLRFAPYPGKGLPEEFSTAAERTSSAAVSASDVRYALEEGSFQSAAALTPPTTWPYLVAELMARALKMELDAPLKPGLVDSETTGAHSDMDYALMLGSIQTIRRSFIRHTSILNKDADSIVEFGKAIERDVMEYTGGVNTYRGAIFALGLAALAHLPVICNSLNINYSHNNHPLENRGRLVDKHLKDRQLEITAAISRLSEIITPTDVSNGGKAVREHGVKGALQMAREGYKPLFGDWLPFYQGFAAESWSLQKTLLRIMSTLDDTCVIHRVGYQRAQEVKEEAKALLEDFSEEGLREMKKRYDSEGISPGGAADMLALTILIDSLIN